MALSSEVTRTTRTFLRPNLQEVDGFLVFLNNSFTEENIRAAKELKLSPGDVVLTGYPTTLTTWMQYIMWEVLNYASDPKTNPLPHHMLYEKVPFVEMLGTDVFKDRPHPWLLRTHLPYDMAPIHPQAKYIYVARNPKDCCVSYYHFFTQFPGVYPENMPFEDFAENFIEGYVPFGDYFDHILSWYRHKDDLNMLIVTYEEMTSDIEGVFLRVAEFLNGERCKEVLSNDRATLGRLIDNVSFRNMKHLPVLFNTNKPELPTETEDNTNANVIKLDFFRKGIVGDWRNHFTEDLRIRLDRLTEEKLEHTHLYDLWKDI